MQCVPARVNIICTHLSCQNTHYPKTTYVTSKWYLAFLFLCITQRPHMSQGNGILPSYFCALPTDHICHKQMVSCLTISAHYPQTTYVTSKWYPAFLFLCIIQRPHMSQANGILPSYFCALSRDHICHKQMVSCLPISVHYPETTYVTSKWYLALLFLCIIHRPHMSQANGILPSYFCALSKDHICHKQMVSCLPISVQYPQTTYVTSKWYPAFLFLCIIHRPRMSQANGILPCYFCTLPTDHICHKQMVSCLPISVHYPQTTYVTSKWYPAFLFLYITHRPHMSQANGILPSYFCALPTDHICNNNNNNNNWLF